MLICVFMLRFMFVGLVLIRLKVLNVFVVWWSWKEEMCVWMKSDNLLFMGFDGVEF